MRIGSSLRQSLSIQFSFCKPALSNDPFRLNVIVSCSFVWAW